MMELGPYSYLFNKEAQEQNELHEAPVLPSILKDPLGQAYSDAAVGYMAGEELRAAGVKIPERNLNYRDKRWLTPQKWAMIMKQATPGGYNDFDPNKVFMVFSKFSHLRIQGAREGSPATYVRGFKNRNDLYNFLSATKIGSRADEVSIEKEGGFPMRIGWDYLAIKLTLEKMLDGGNVKEDILNKVVVRIWWD